MFIAIYRSALSKCHFKFWGNFIIGLFISLLLSSEYSFYILDTRPLSDNVTCILPVSVCPFHFLNRVCHRAKVFHFGVVGFIFFSPIIFHVPGITSKNSSPKLRSQIFVLCSLVKVLECFTVIHLQTIFK